MRLARARSEPSPIGIEFMLLSWALGSFSFLIVNLDMFEPLYD